MKRRAMWVRATAGAAACAAVAVPAGVARDARAEASRCTAARLVARDAPPSFVADVRALEAQLAALAPEECRRVTVRVEPAAKGATLVLEAADGRRAERFVSRPSALVAVALGVIASIPAEASADVAAPPSTPESAGASAAPLAPPSESPAAPPAPPLARAPGDDLDLPPSTPSTAGERASIVAGHGPRGIRARPSPASFALASGARAGFPTGAWMLDVEARGRLLVGDTLVLVSARVAPVGATSDIPLDDDSYNEVALGAGLGRRIAAGDTAFEASLMPTVTLVSMESDAIVDGERGGRRAQLRVNGSLAWASARAGALRFVALLDGEVAPYSLAHAVRVDPALPPIPAWTLGARIGASVEAP